MKRSSRQDEIIDIIRTQEISTQEELTDALKERGYTTTQATVSRDIRELNIAKMTTGKGRYRYVLPRRIEDASGVKFSAALIESIVSVNNAGNLVVLKTYPGLASAVAAGIDSMKLHQILGCIAGDDTIFVLTVDPESADALAKQVHDLLKNI